MSFLDNEISLFNSQPTELYKITRLTTTYFYTNRKKDIVFDGNTYIPTNIKRDPVRITESELDSKLNVTIVSSSDLITDAKYSYDNYPFSIQIWRLQNKNTNNFVSIWKSKVSQLVVNTKESTLVCEGGTSEMYIPALTRVFAYGCRHILYDDSKFGCKVDKSLYEENETISTIPSRSVITFVSSSIPSTGSVYFRGGIADFGNGIKRDIVSYTIEVLLPGSSFRNTLTLIKPLSQDILVGASFKLYPGCNHNSTDCNNKFSNIENFGGYENIPVNNPHTGVGILYYDGE